MCGGGDAAGAASSPPCRCSQEIRRPSLAGALPSAATASQPYCQASGLLTQGVDSDMRRHSVLGLLLAGLCAAQPGGAASSGKCQQALQAQEWVLSQFENPSPEMGEMLEAALQKGKVGGVGRPLSLSGRCSAPLTAATARRRRRWRSRRPDDHPLLCPQASMVDQVPFFTQQTSWAPYAIQNILASTPWGSADLGEGGCPGAACRCHWRGSGVEGAWRSTQTHCPAPAALPALCSAIRGVADQRGLAECDGGPGHH